MEDIIGKKYGLIEVVEFVKTQKHPNHNCYKHYYIGRCECGNEKEYVRTNLITGHTKSCGCLKRRRGSKNPTFLGTGEIGASHWTGIRRHAETRNLIFEITPMQAWQKFQQQEGKCALTGLPISTNNGRNQKTGAIVKTASLDRIDSTIGYTVQNIQWVHKDINRMKNAFDIARFKELCALVTQHSWLRGM